MAVGAEKLSNPRTSQSSIGWPPIRWTDGPGAGCSVPDTGRAGVSEISWLIYLRI